jgi:Zn-dependent protease with chaperone function
VLWPCRNAATLNLLFLPAALQVWQAALIQDAPFWLLGFSAAFAGAVTGSFPMCREVFPRFDLAAWKREKELMFLMRAGPWLLVLAAGANLPDRMWPVGWLIAAVMTIFLVWYVRDGWFQVALKCGLAGPASSGIRDMVMRVTGPMGVNVNQVWVIHWSLANAFALPYSKSIAFTERALEIHPESELVAICAHEAGHLTESRLILFLRTSAALWFLPLMFIGPMVGLYGLKGYFALAAVSITALLLFPKLSQRMETRADNKASTDAAGRQTFAEALERLHRDSLIPAVFSRAQTHPHLYDRLTTVGIVPAYPRPKPPGKSSWTSNALLGLVFVGVIFYFVNTSEEYQPDPQADRGSIGSESSEDLLLQ